MRKNSLNKLSCIALLCMLNCTALAKADLSKEAALSRYGNPLSYVINGKRYHPLSSSLHYSEVGVASWYGPKFHRQKTSNGETFNMYRLSAAHRTLPLPTKVKVTNLENGKSIILRVNDRGPFYDNRLIDLSFAAAKQLGMARQGTAVVRVTALTKIFKPNGQLTPSKPQFFMQLGAFSQYQNALALRNQLQHLLPYNLQIKHSHTTEQTVYKVLAGPLTHFAQSQQLRNRLNQLGINNLITVLE